MTFIPIAGKLNLQEELTEALNINDVFSFEIGKYTFTINETTVVSWVIIVLMTVLALILTRNLKVDGEISKRQALLELCYEKAEGFFKGLMDEKVHRFIPWLMSTALFIGISNTIGLLLEPFYFLKPPTKSMQMTAVLAVSSIVIVEYSAFRDKGFGGRLKAFTRPMGIITPINIMEVFTKPLSLCMRLFGNVLAAFTIMELIKIVTRHIYVPVIPVVFSLYFDIFDGLLQAYIFVFLTALYLNEAVEPLEVKPKKKRKNKRSSEAAE